MASIYVYSKSSTSVSVRLTGLETSGIDYTRKCTWTAYEKSSMNSAAGGNSYITAGSSEGGDFTLSGLSPNTEYTINCIVYRADTGAWLANISSVSVTTTSSGSGGGGGSTTNIAHWSWSSANDVATLLETQRAYTAITSKGATTRFSHWVWVAMVNLVKALTDATIGYWDTDYASYNDTEITEEPYTLTATVFNSLRNNLELVGTSLGLAKIPDGDGTVSGTIPHPATKGGKVYGHYFLTITDYINSCVDKL